MWEICKNTAAAASEFDRTIKYVEDTIVELKKIENSASTFTSTGGVVAQIRRAPLGVVLCSGPFNYPFNETYTTLIPSLIMGNTVVMKLPVGPLSFLSPSHPSAHWYSLPPPHLRALPRLFPGWCDQHYLWLWSRDYSPYHEDWQH